MPPMRAQRTAYVFCSNSGPNPSKRKAKQSIGCVGEDRGIHRPTLDRIESAGLPGVRSSTAISVIVPAAVSPSATENRCPISASKFFREMLVKPAGVCASEPRSEAPANAANAA